MAQQNPAAALANARRLLAPARAALASYPNVAGVGVGLRRQEGARTNEVCFVVSVTQKQDMPDNGRLPRMLFGIPIDVVEQHKASLMTGLRAGELVRQDQGTPKVVPGAMFGHIGMLANEPDVKSCALNVLHTFVDVNRVADFPPKADGYFNVQARVTNTSDYDEIGMFVEGSFSAFADIARIQLADFITPHPGLIASNQNVLPPVDLISGPLNIDVRICADGKTVEGVLTDYPSGPVDVAGAQFELQDLAVFEFAEGSIQEGWSGSVVYDTNGAALALLTCASTPGASPQTAYGFSLAPHWRGWDLTPV